MNEIAMTESPYGRFLTCPWETVSQGILSGAFWDEFLKPYFDKYSDPEGVAVDIGANLGFHSVYLSKCNRKVYAFEMQKWVYWMLCGNLALNFCYNVEPICAAAFAHDGRVSIATEEQVQFHFPQRPDGQVDHRITQYFSSVAVQDAPGDISACTVDSVVGDDGPVRIIKTDAQGSDLRALMGCRAIIERWRPVILFEYENCSATVFGDTLENYYEYLRPFGYHFTILQGGGAIADVACEQEAQ